MKSIFTKLVSVAAFMALCLFVEYYAALHTSKNGCEAGSGYEAEQQSNTPGEPDYPLPAMHILQIW